MAWTTYFVSLYPIPNPCFPFFFFVFFFRFSQGRARLAQRSGCPRPQGPGSSVKWDEIFGQISSRPYSDLTTQIIRSVLCHFYISGYQLLHSIASTILHWVGTGHGYFEASCPLTGQEISHSPEKGELYKLPQINIISIKCIAKSQDVTPKCSKLQSQSSPVSRSHDNTSSLVWWVQGWIMYRHIGMWRCFYCTNWHTGDI